MKILLFIGLKIVEIGGFIFLPYWIGLLLMRLEWDFMSIRVMKDSCFMVWFGGLLSLLIFILIPTIIVAFLYVLAESNWNLVNHILK